MQTRRTFILGICLPVLLAGCRTLRSGEMPPQLHDRLRLFEGVVRWGALDRMYGFLKPDLLAEVTIPEGLGNIRVINYETASGPARLDEDRWTQTVAIEYVRQDQQVVKTLIDQQTWERAADSDAWYRVSPIPTFR